MENIVQGQWFRGPSADLGTPIDGSLRFNPDNSTNIQRTFASAGNTVTNTLAFWFKNPNSDWSDYSTPTPFVAFQDSNNYVQFQLDRDTRGMVLRINAVVGGINVINKITTGNFADPSAWYHLCVVFDTTNATAEDRTRIYVNGIRCTDFGTNTNCAQNQGLTIGGAFEHNFGKQTNFSACGGYLADVYFIDGTAVGETNSVIDEFIRINDQDICVPKAYSGSYGTNGFHLDFNSTTLDTGNTRFTDQSGQSNHFTYANFDTTTTSTAYPLSNDSPTDNYAVLLHNNGHPGAPGAPDCILGGTVANSWSATHGSINTSFAVKEGKYYWEWRRANTATFHAGICDVETGGAYKTYTGGNHFSVGTDGGGAIYANGSVTGSGIGNVDNGDTMGCAIDFDANTFKAWVDGTAMNSGNDFLGSENIDRNDTGNTNNPRRISPACGHSSGAEIEFHSGAHGGFTNGFRQTAPANHKKLRTSDLPEIAVTRPQDHFRVVNYGGNNADRTIDFGFRPDFVCIFQTVGSSSAVNRIFDSCNGLTSGYFSMSDNGARITSSDYITAVSDTGVTIKSGASNEGINEDSHRYSAWGFKMGGAPTASNSNTSGAMAANSVSIDGELQSAYTPSGSPTIYPYKMSINTEAKMSIVLYEGNNTDGATVPHGLGVPPASIWVKRMSASDDWRVYHHCEEAGASKYLRFESNPNTVESDDSWNATAPNSNTFSLGQVSNVNAGSTYIAICFAEVDGFSAFGMNYKNTDNEGPFAVTMFEPALVFGKDGNRGDHWWAFDNDHEPRNPMDFGYRLNLNGANNLNFGELAFYANGFRHLAASGEHNYGDGPVLWFAFAHRPFGGKNSAPNTGHFDSNLPAA